MEMKAKAKKNPRGVVLVGDARTTLPTLPEGSVHCCVTSPPYWGLRDYGHTGQLGLEKTPEEYVANLVEVFREVRRVLVDEGTLWLNLGDSYHGSWGNSGNRPELDGKTSNQRTKEVVYLKRGGWDERRERPPSSFKIEGLKPKDLVGIPWRVAFALQADGWYLRSDIIWAKPNPMPESVTDRPTKAHEYLFLLSKSARYYYDHEAIKEPNSSPEQLAHNQRYAKIYDNQLRIDGGQPGNTNHVGKHERAGDPNGGRNRRSVWTVATAPYSEAHFATYPPKLIEPCIKAGCPVGGTVLDPFGGSGTTAAVAHYLRRSSILCELNPEYASLVPKRVESLVAREQKERTKATLDRLTEKPKGRKP